MIGTQTSLHTIAEFFGALANQSNACRSITACFCYHSSFRTGSRHRRFSKLRLNLRSLHCCRSKSIIISCNAYRGSSDALSNADDEYGRDYIEATVLLPETIRHYQLRMRGFQEGTKWQASRELFPFSIYTRDYRADINVVGLDFLRRFHSPTIFLKISCDGDFVLPIIVGDFAVEKLIDASLEDESGDCLNHFQLVRNLVVKVGYEVKMVRITERIANTYFARIYLTKPGERGVCSVDARPSDAINVASRCRAPIYVNKQIVSADGKRIAYGMGRMRDTKSVYDVSLDSAADGPDLLSEELVLVKNMNLAVEEERYTEAAMLRDKLMKLRDSRHEL